MASKNPEEEPFNTETDNEETIAQRKKRSQRRVSFADREITSVYIFNRDEDYETPPKQPNSPMVGPDADEGSGQVVLGFFKDLAASTAGSEDDSKDLSPNEDENDIAASFLRPLESPGSSIIGSATSNDDNFFGPVSANFIRPGRLSDSAASDDNHDITMDSTAFSMHFRSFAGSESGDLRTATGVRLGFEEKTPTQITTPTDSGSFMVLTKPKKLIPNSCSLADKGSYGKDSNDMSLVGENPHKYDYGKLSPTLEALLAEGSKDLHAASVSNPTNSILLNKSEASTFDENGSGHNNQMAYGDPETSNFAVHDISAEGVSVQDSRFSEGNGGHLTTVFGQITHDCFADTKESPAAVASVDRWVQSPNKLNKVGLFALHECGLQSSTADCLKENFPINRRLNPDVDQISAEQNGSPLAGSISSLSAKRQHLFHTANSPKHSLYMTPTKQPGSLLSKESPKQGFGVPSTQKSSSKLKIAKPSPYASALIEKIETSKLRIAGYLSSYASPFNTVKYVDLPITNLEDRLLGTDTKSKDPNVTVNVKNNGIGTVKDIDGLSQNENTAGLGKDGESLDHMSTDILNKKKPSHKITAATSPAHLTWSGKNMMQHNLMSENLKEGTTLISESSSSPVEITFDQSKDKKATNVPDKLVSPVVKKLDEKLSTEFESIYGHLEQLSQNNKFSGISSGRDENLIETTVSDRPSSAIAGNLKSPERRAESSSPLIEVNSSKDFIQARTMDDREIYSPELRNVFESFRNFQTLPKDRANPKSQSESPVKNLQVAADPTQSQEEPHRDKIKVASHAYASPYADRRSLQKILSLNELSRSPHLKQAIRSPSRIQLLPTSHDGRDMPCSQPRSDNHCHNDSYQALDFVKSPGLKRKIGEIVLGDTDHENEISRIDTAGKVHKSVTNDIDFMCEHSNGRNNREEKIEGDRGLRHWTDISLKFSSNTNELHSSLIAKLNIRVVGMLEDILGHLQKVNRYEMLYSSIHSQETNGHSTNKRVFETRSLLHKIVYEKAKMQLICVKREKLLKKIQLLSSGIQKTQILKNNILHFSISGKRNAEVDGNCHNSGFVNDKHKVASEKLTTSRHEFEALDRKIKNLTKSLYAYCKLKGEPSCSDNVVLLKDHLKQRTCCRLIRQDLQLWEVNNLESRNDHRTVVLNYLGLISQRFTIIAGPVSSVSISNKLNDINIMKNFPNMDAYTAFAFVLNAESTNKYVGVRSLAQETQTTSSLLRNLLDVVEEIQAAQIEIRNLTQTSFKTPSVEQLDLQLAFINFSSGRKVTITLDLTSLKCGIYPLEILPYKIQAPVTKTEKLMPDPLSDGIKTAADSVRVGYSRILRLCRCVSQFVQSKSR